MNFMKLMRLTQTVPIMFPMKKESYYFDNFIFDLYGTLIDIKTDEHAPDTWIKWAKWLDEREIVHPAPMLMHDEFFEMDMAARDKARGEGVFTHPEIDVIPIYRTMFLEYGNPEDMITAELLDDAGYAFRTASREYMKLFPNVIGFLEKIKGSGRHAYILSNAQRCYTLPEIKYFGLDKAVDDYLISSDYGCMKPDILFYNELINRYNMDCERTVMIGDSHENDYEGGINAGINAIWLGGENSAETFYCAKGPEFVK